jgi:hypothetical protein
MPTMRKITETASGKKKYFHDGATGMQTFNYKNAAIDSARNKFKLPE